MATVRAGDVRPPLHLLAAESDMVASLALQAEHRQPVVAAMLLEEIERAELHEPGRCRTRRDDRLGSRFRRRTHPPAADRGARLPGAGKYRLRPDFDPDADGRRALRAERRPSIDWPDLDGEERRIRILRVRQPLDEPPAAA